MPSVIPEFEVSWRVIYKANESSCLLMVHYQLLKFDQERGIIAFAPVSRVLRGRGLISSLLPALSYILDVKAFIGNTKPLAIYVN